MTGAEDFPDFLSRDVKDGVLQVYSNGEFTYTLRGVHARVSVTWNFEAPPGAGDTHFSVMRGTKANLVIRQGAEQKFKPVLYVERASSVTPAEHELALSRRSPEVAEKYPGVVCRREGDHYVVTVPRSTTSGTKRTSRRSPRTSCVPARRTTAGLGSAEHDHEVRDDHEGVRDEPVEADISAAGACTGTGPENPRRAPTVQVAIGLQLNSGYFLHESCRLTSINY